MSGDPLSEALALINARAVVAGAFTSGGDWAIRLRPRGRLKLTAVVRGSCWLTAAGVDQPVRLHEGDVVVLNDRAWDVLASDLSLEPIDASPLFAEQPDRVVRIGDGQDVAVVGSHVDMDRGGDDLLLATLAPLTHLRANAAQAPVLRWLLDRLLTETSADLPGSGFAAHQYAHLLFVEVLRAYLADADSFPPGWLRLLATESLAPALHLMHSDPARPWHLTDLARAVAMSRTTFAQRFRTAAGMPPLTYLHHWRMRLAERALREDDAPIANLASTLGYSSESAFSTAFKRTTGTAPKRYRDTSRQMAPPLR
jgi:AraC-like DNA-binding protein